LPKKHHEIIDNNEHNPSIQRSSLAELLGLNITLSDYFDVAPSIVNGIPLPITSPETNKAAATREFIV
jgi:hypothetical protein